MGSHPDRLASILERKVTDGACFLEQVCMDRSKVPARYLRIYDSAMAGRSKKAAITAHCIMCMGWNRRLVSKCTATGCPLYPHRPVVKPRKAKASA